MHVDVTHIECEWGKGATRGKHPCTTTIHLLQRYERHRKIRNEWHAWRLRDHPGLSATWQHMSTCADREHVMKTLRSNKGICVNNLTISVVTYQWAGQQVRGLAKDLAIAGIQLVSYNFSRCFFYKMSAMGYFQLH